MTTLRTGRLLGAVSVAVLALGTAACGSGDSASGGSGDSGGKLAVTTSTNVWGSVVSAIGGDQVEVRSIIDDPSGDPHSYQATPEDAVDVQDAKFVLYNGGGYDDFFTKLAEQAPEARKVVAFDVSGKGAEGSGAEAGHDHEHAEGEAGHDHEHAEGSGGEAGHDHEHGVNEHVWYDLPTVSKVADQVAAELGQLRPEAKQTFDGNATAFKGRIDELTGKAAKIGGDRPGAKVLATEPVAHYLLEAAKLTDATPEDFSKAIEEESDVPVAAQDAVNQLVTGKQVRAVVHNSQTSTPVTDQLVANARSAGLPVVDVTETLPEGQSDYIAWMTQEVDALTGALSGT
ncbi:metal ABC transporter substrate-binding protein [Amycolatopsis antarctica]|uniref:Metal ABC transporter substrate-binding protein n=1 Tax=Amycolatopsis antarctica TaxID=1854586 RepID=A0A263CYC0_9PSEU|nr:zinc ABC transporter substrate-binding protein [Amycolatopsis antarctica]OZM70918.1 metal ABC transporter substrate-binding protein [Amycolatopsis antarctica]